jgi:hypothetical protein
MAVVAEHLLGKWEALISIPSTFTKKKKERKKEKK